MHKTKAQELKPDCKELTCLRWWSDGDSHIGNGFPIQQLNDVSAYVGMVDVVFSTALSFDDILCARLVKRRTFPWQEWTSQWNEKYQNMVNNVKKIKIELHSY
jgi:hypothetical protein